jgi:hypothetical protein
LVKREDTDGDGVDNETELLLGRNPGEKDDVPGRNELSAAKKRRAEFSAFLSSYRWQPFEVVKPPPVPKIGGTSSARPTSTSAREKLRTGGTRPSNQFQIRNPIDAFVAAEHKARGLKTRPEAPKEILLRRVYLDLIGLSPMPEERAAFENDPSPDAYEKVVDRLLADPRHGERWGRHWMDVWRYSDWAGWSGGNQIRDSKPHIWRWRDWIVESLNSDKGYDRMVMEMLAADEMAPQDTNVLRATGFLARNYKMLSREQWLEDTVKHTSQGLLGMTVGCAKCHDHMYDPISQAEYYQMRAVFEPHWVRTDRLPGNTNLMELGLVRVFDTDTNPPTYFFLRGDERKPDTNRLMAPGVPKSLGGTLEIQPVSLPWLAAHPDKREFVYQDALAAADKVVADTRAKRAASKTNASAAKVKEQELSTVLVEAQRDALAAVIAAERLEDAGQKESDDWKRAATNAVVRQREAALADAKLRLHQAKAAEAEAQKRSEEAAANLALATNEVQQVAATKNDSLKARKDAVEKTAKSLTEAKKKLADAEKSATEANSKLKAPADHAFKRRATDDYPTNSTGRRLAFARWVASTNNPLTARVAVNQIWLRHFGQGLVQTPGDFGRNGKAPSHPQLLDWLASELMRPNVPPASRRDSAIVRRQDASGTPPWSMKHLHRLIVTSSTYRRASTPDETNGQIDPDNIY